MLHQAMGPSSGHRALLAGAAFLAILVSASAGCVQAMRPTEQLSIPRIEQMPAEPRPFRPTDWNRLAAAYDNLVFDFAAKGKHLPLIWWDDTRINMDRRMFGLPSYAGVPHPANGSGHEAVTVLASLLGAALAGIDKGAGPTDWVSMAEGYYSRKDGLVLNNTTARTGGSYWYEIYPQILFDSLADRYPDHPRLTRIMRDCTDRWLEALACLRRPDGSLDFSHTAFSFAAMKPVDNGRWREPDAAAGLAWIFYASYIKFGDPKYLAAANECLTCLDRRDENPLYEVLLPFGACAAARINAQHGGRHDLDKLLKWCFEPSSTARRGWGAIVGHWGGYDVSGLIGSVTDGGGYAFVMNTYAWAMALAPVARYDERYARAIARWMLNASNAMRLCYPDQLPLENQSCPAVRDEPIRVIAYEGLRRDRKGKSPYATGDIVVRGEGPTDLALYGSGLVGVLRAIVRPTNEPMIPLLDLAATDFFADRSYPTYLVWNPHGDRRTIAVPVGNNRLDLYDAVANAFVVRGARGAAQVVLEPDQARLLVLVPSGATITRRGQLTLASGIVIDYRNGYAGPTPPK
jgi:hypothetical protein